MMIDNTIDGDTTTTNSDTISLHVNQLSPRFFRGSKHGSWRDGTWDQITNTSWVPTLQFDVRRLEKKYYTIQIDTCVPFTK